LTGPDDADGIDEIEQSRCTRDRRDPVCGRRYALGRAASADGACDVWALVGKPLRRKGLRIRRRRVM